MSHIKYHSVVLFVNDIQISKNFYQNILNMEVEYDFGNNIVFKGGLSIWKVSEDHEIKKNTDDKNLAMELYFESDALDSAVQRLKIYGIKLLHDVKEESWGQRTIRFYDPDNNLVELGESMPTFIGRLAEHMCHEAIAQKTGIALNDIENILKSK